MGVSSERGPALSAVKLALLAQRARDELDADGVLAAEPVAIIGMGCRFPGGAGTPEAFWTVLADGVDAVSEVPADRWDVDAFYDPDPYAPGMMSSRWGGFLDGIDQFDAAFFGISPREAARMDPQQRLVLEVALEALDRAGQPRDKLAGSLTGVFVAATLTDYGDRQYGSRPDIDAHSVTGTMHCIIPNRLSYLLDLRGPSVAVDTACSSSLVAIHTACQSLRNRDRHMAIAGGVNVILSPEPGIALSKWGVLASDGRCKTFDARADGFVRSEGCGIIVLKRLADAVADGDPVLAVVRGSAVNQDGRSTAMSAPNGLAQRAVVTQALRNGRVAPEQISYVEAHGTGTALGDPIEVEALADVVGGCSPGAPPVALTSLKTNMGHLEAAAGVAGVIKVVMCLQHEAIPPHLHFTSLNPHISLDDTRFFIPTAAYAWRRGPASRLAGVSSFGFGGTNAHVVVEEAPRLPGPAPAGGPYVLPLSAQSPGALRETVERIRAQVVGADEEGLADVCYTVSARRTHYDERVALVAPGPAEMLDRLERLARGDTHPGVVTGRREPGEIRRMAFVFSGQGPQWWGMGRELLAREPVFAEVVARCDDLLREHVAWSVLEELSRPQDESRLDRTDLAQPALFAIQVGLAALWRSWGIVPHAVIGHSVGEVAAADVAGALSLEDAVRVIAHRGALMQAAAGTGKMASVELAADAVAGAAASYGDDVVVAAFNSPQATVISGAPGPVDDLVEALKRAGAVVRPLPVNYAFHSPQVADHAAALERALVGLAPAPTAARFVSTVTGAVAPGAELGATYWRRNVREPVRFAAAVETAAALGCSVFVEIGPHPVLGAAVVQTLVDRPTTIVACSLRRGRPERDAMLTALAELYACGVPIDWDRVLPQRRRVVALPPYPWQRQRHWYDARPALAPGPVRQAGGASHPLLGHPVRSAAITGHVFENELSTTTHPLLAGHRIGPRPLLSATTFLELGAAALHAASGIDVTTIVDLDLRAPLLLSATPVTVQVHVEDGADGTAFTVHRLCDDDAWALHAAGRLGATSSARPGAVDLDGIRQRCTRIVTGAELYADLAARDADFGPGFRAIETIAVGDGEALGRAVLPDAVGQDASRYWFHPGLLDACLHPLNTLLPDGDATFLPVALDAMRLHARPMAQLWSHVRAAAGASVGSLTVDATLLADDGSVVAELVGLRLRRVDPGALAADGGSVADGLLHELVWEPAPVAAAPWRPAGPWLIYADRSGIGAEVAALLRAGGDRCVLVPSDVELTEAGVAAALAEVGAAGVLYLRSLDTPTLDTPTLDTPTLDDPTLDATDIDLVGAQRHGLGGALAVVQALVAAPARLWLITRGAEAIGGPPAAPEQAPVVGLGATVAVEQPDLRCVRVDLDPGESVGQSAAGLMGLLGATDGEDHVAVRARVRVAARLVPCPSAERPDGGEQPTRLTAAVRGVLDHLELVPAERRAPGPGEVEIRVEVTGLNFRDVLIALDLYPEPVSTFGEECSGVVVRVGPDVDGLRPGDRVMAMGSGSFATYLTTPAALVTPMPDGMTFEDAATIPIAFLTAQYALVDLGRIRAGERVLIHAAAGGVGLAAVQIAQRAGAVVFATAGTPEKRDLLRRLGVAHVSDSRSLDFADEVLGATAGAGVDLVLNSLNGDFIPRSLDTLAIGGRFLEIGKRGIWDADQVAAVRPDAHYVIVFLGDRSVGDPAAIQAMFGDLLPRFADGTLTPLDKTVFALDDVVGAFRYMAQARHIGKVVVRQPVAVDAVIQRDGTYLVTGGLGGIGLVIAADLADRGAGSLALVGRHAPDAGALDAIAALRARGVDVHCFQADVADGDAVAGLVAEIEHDAPPLRGIVHAAGVNADAAIPAQTWDRFTVVLAAKLAGAWHLHRAAEGRHLDFFVMFSSAAAVLGSPGQANYGAANAFLDALAVFRRGHGDAGLSIGWGPWDRIGMTARLDDQAWERVQRRGYVPLTEAQGRAAFALALTGDRAHVVAARLDAGDVRAARSIPTSTPPPSAGPLQADLVERLAAMAPPMRRGAVAAIVREQAAKVLGLPLDQAVEPRQALSELGLDSLMAVELRTALGLAIGRTLPATLLFDHPTTESLVDFLVAEVTPAETDAAAPVANGNGHSAPPSSVAEVAAMTEAEAEALLLAELGQPGVTP